MSTPARTHPNRPMGQMNNLLRDLITVASLGILLVFVHYFSKPFWRGFHCDDDTLRYPLKPSTIPSSMCYGIGSALNVLLILILEYRSLAFRADSSQEEQNEGLDFRLYARNVYCRMIVWLFGAISSELLTDISKFAAGRLRPHFIDKCRPYISDVSYESYCLDPKHRTNYILDYHCTGLEGDQRDARLSFMSGHSSYAAYSATFAILYIQSKLDMLEFGLIKPATQVLIASAAFYTGLTRISDYKHHWQDVLTGLFQGLTVASAVSYLVWPSYSKMYAKRPRIPRSGDEHLGEELNRVSY